jgi:glycosyltransferase involved in cell wall biosynthesis
MRLGMLTQWFDPEPGPAAVPGVLARGLAGRGHGVRVLTGFPNYPHGSVYDGYRQALRHVETTAPGVEVRRVPLYPSHDDRVVNRAANYLSFAGSAATRASRYLGDADAVWVYNSPATVGAVAAHLRRRRRAPFLLHVMDVWPDSVLASAMLGSRRARQVAERALTALVSHTYDAASVIAVTSPGQLDLLRSRGVPGDKLRYVPVWADEEIFHPRPADRDLLPESARDASLVLMYAGSLGHVQNLEASVEAAAAARDVGVHLVLVGGGIAEPALRARAADLRAENVHFLGAVPPAAMGPLSAAADVHLVSLADTPLLRVTMPSKVQAIMAMGRPIVAACAGDAAATVTGAGAGVAVTPGSVQELTATLRDLASATSALTDMGTAARRHYLQEFSRDGAVAAVESLLVEVAR